MKPNVSTKGSVYLSCGEQANNGGITRLHQRFLLCGKFAGLPLDFGPKASLAAGLAGDVVRCQLLDTFHLASPRLLTPPAVLSQGKASVIQDFPFGQRLAIHLVSNSSSVRPCSPHLSSWSSPSASERVLLRPLSRSRPLPPQRHWHHQRPSALNPRALRQEHSLLQLALQHRPFPPP